MHEITKVFPLLFLLGRARRKEALEQKNCSALRYGLSPNIHLSNTATSERGSKRFAVVTGACGMAIGRGKTWILVRAGATEKNPPASERPRRAKALLAKAAGPLLLAKAAVQLPASRALGVEAASGH